MRSTTSRVLICSLADALLVFVGPVALAAILGADVAFIFRHDPDLAYGFLVPLSLFAGVWGFFDARAHLSGQPRTLRAALTGGAASAGAALISQVFGFVRSAYAVGSTYPVIGGSTVVEWFQYGASVVLISAAIGLAGAICAAALSAMNGVLLRALPS